jgi:hypothetical protein
MERMNTALHPISITDLWREARSWLADALHDFLGPVEIARTLARKARSAIRRRLALIEALLMKLLLIEAARHPGWTARLQARTATAAGPCAPGGARSNLSPAEDPTNPATWRVRFRLRIPPDPKRVRPMPPRDTGGPRIRDLGRPLLVRDIWREQARRSLIDRLRPKPNAEAAHARAQRKARKLARRFEALRRVLADPRRAIVRLARKLAALAAGACAAARRIALAPAPRKRQGKTFANAIVHAHDSCGAFRNDTS